MDVSRIARLPMTADYFPDLHNGAVSNFGQDPAMAAKVTLRIRELIANGFEVMPVDLTSKE
ncbi:hypothetical protein S58_26450 [Bradyrhizobium oligotrophicum S58]|uniref:Uncharacterized protein n=1 Tax=Bradyrhizobium oligotrophicum S58 TaxID=1245469 RepID=M4Z6H2_9BRAD|nr:hypothetical protein S58_26450 [Bradyrhizobium oligotrophicum S58]